MLEFPLSFVGDEKEYYLLGANKIQESPYSHAGSSHAQSAIGEKKEKGTKLSTIHSNLQCIGW